MVFGGQVGGWAALTGGWSGKLQQAMSEETLLTDRLTDDKFLLVTILLLHY